MWELRDWEAQINSYLVETQKISQASVYLRMRMGTRIAFAPFMSPVVTEEHILLKKQLAWVITFSGDGIFL